MKKLVVLFIVILSLLVVMSCGVNTIKSQYRPEVWVNIDSIIIFYQEDVPPEMKNDITEMGLIEVRENPLHSWKYVETKAKEKAYLTYGVVDFIGRATARVESSNPPMDMEKVIRGAVFRFNDEEIRKKLREWLKNPEYRKKLGL